MCLAFRQAIAAKGKAVARDGPLNREAPRSDCAGKKPHGSPSPSRVATAGALAETTKPGRFSPAGATLRLLIMSAEYRRKRRRCQEQTTNILRKERSPGWPDQHRVRQAPGVRFQDSLPRPNGKSRSQDQSPRKKCKTKAQDQTFSCRVPCAHEGARLRFCLRQSLSGVARATAHHGGFGQVDMRKGVCYTPRLLVARPFIGHDRARERRA